MSDINITVEGGSKRLLTGGKYCPADIVVTASGGGEVNMNNCTVTIKPAASTNHYAASEHVDSNAIVYNMTRSYTGADIRKTARCDSILYVMASNIKSVTATDGEVLEVKSGQGVAFKTPSTAGANVVLTLSSEVS